MLLELDHAALELLHDRRGEADLTQPLVDAPIPPNSAVLASVEAAPDSVHVDRPLQIRENGVRVVKFVGGTDPSRGFIGRAKPIEVVLAALVTGQLDTIVVERALRNREHGVEHLVAELLAHAVREHVARIMLADAILDHVVEDAGNYGL